MSLLEDLLVDTESIRRIILAEFTVCMVVFSIKILSDCSCCRAADQYKKQSNKGKVTSHLPYVKCSKPPRYTHQNAGNVFIYSNVAVKYLSIMRSKALPSFLLPGDFVTSNALLNNGPN